MHWPVNDDWYDGPHRNSHIAKNMLVADIDRCINFLKDAQQKGFQWRMVIIIDY
ncbi:MAG: hypothetical protein GY810_23050 [Aureispira sp.]|nr:hypothetical protein [Aureispira sp.]